MTPCCSFRCSYRSLFWGLAVLGVVADQVSKYRVFQWLYNDGRGDQQEIIPGAFQLHTRFATDPDGLPLRETGAGLLASLRTLGGDILPQVNHGALFGLGNEHVGLANKAFAAISIVAAAAIIYWGSRRTTSRDPILSVALGLILAGTLGNLYDRLVFGGVRDFLYFYYIEWPVFNVADCCLVCGAFLLLVQAFWARPSAKHPALTQSAKDNEEAGALADPSESICEQPLARP
jgi:lipoprotein signal peptidase